MSLENNNNENQHHCESDIEVISNPSQSSIEVIGTGSQTIRYANTQENFFPKQLLVSTISFYFIF